jgi:hypothetical protein
MLVHGTVPRHIIYQKVITFEGVWLKELGARWANGLISLVVWFHVKVSMSDWGKMFVDENLMS